MCLRGISGIPIVFLCEVNQVSTSGTWDIFAACITTLTDHKLYMERCLELARKAIGYVAPNPMVGAVLVHENRIIGEGWHREFGQAHAEVNCIDSVIEDDKKYIAYSTLYVSLEPCSHFGKTPPCADLIIKKRNSACSDRIS